MIDYQSKIESIKNKGLFRQRCTLSSAQSSIIKINNTVVCNFSSNDYLSLANHPLVIESFISGIKKYGVGAGASHLVSGHFDVHDQLEFELASFTGQERSLLFSSGYQANIGVLSALSDSIDWVIQDKLNHASLIDANKLISRRVERYKHNDLSSLEKKISSKTESGLIVTDNIFSMDGDSANIDGIHTISSSKNSVLMQDDAHGFGVFSPNIPKDSIYMATLGKSAGTMGAFVAGNSQLIELLTQKSRSYIYTTAIPPALCEATRTSLKIIQEGYQTNKLHENIKKFKDYSSHIGLNINDSKSGIQPIIIGDNEKVIKIQAELLSKGFYVGAIRSPTVPKGSERLRVTLTSDHTEEQIFKLIDLLKSVIS